jgi:hypothetical protein
MNGLPLIVSLCILDAALATWQFTDIRADLRLREVRAIGERNLAQAESKWVACLRGGVFTVGTAIYRCRAEKSEFTTAQVPEVLGRVL